MTNIYFHPQPSKLKNTVSTPQYLDPPTNKVPNPDYPGYQDANAPWGFGINDKDRSLQIWGGPTESDTPDYTSGLEGVTGSRRFQINTKTVVASSDPVGVLQVKGTGGYQFVTITRPDGTLSSDKTPGTLLSGSLGAIRIGGSSNTGTVQIDACYQGGLQWYGNKAGGGGDVRMQLSAATEASGSLGASNTTIQFMRDHSIHYNASSGGSHQFNGSAYFSGSLNTTNGALYLQDANHLNSASKSGIMQTDGNVLGLTWATTANVRNSLTSFLAAKYTPKSDPRTKENIKEVKLDDAIDFVKNVKTYEWDWKYFGKRHSAGFIADESFPRQEFIEETNESIDDVENIKVMDTGNIAAGYLTPVVANLLARVEALEAELKELKAQK